MVDIDLYSDCEVEYFDAMCDALDAIGRLRSSEFISGRLEFVAWDDSERVWPASLHESVDPCEVCRDWCRDGGWRYVSFISSDGFVLGSYEVPRRLIV